MRIRPHLVIFARAPVLGRVKRRLAASIGARAARDFYRQNVARLLRRLGRDRRWRCWLALTPDRAARGPLMWRSPCARIGQGRGDLGRRMARPFERLGPGPLVIIGSDIPELEPHHVAAAFKLLGDHDLVFGPAEDGGYWLVGARIRPLPHGLFAGVRWSTADALSDTIANVPKRFRVGRAPTLADVDEAADYWRWRDPRKGGVTRPSDAPGGAA